MPSSTARIAASAMKPIFSSSSGIVRISFHGRQLRLAAGCDDPVRDRDRLLALRRALVAVGAAGDGAFDGHGAGNVGAGVTPRPGRTAALPAVRLPPLPA